MKRKIIYYSSLVIFLITFIYSAFCLNKLNQDLDKKIRLDNEYKNFEKRFYNTINSVEDYRKYYNNDDIKAIIKIDSLDISSLILQGEDNDYYLSHLENNDSSIYGSLMLDYRTNLDTSKINIIYGHMSSSIVTPFKRLEEYLNYNFYDQNRYIEVVTDKSVYKYEIFSVVNISKNNNKYLTTNFINEQQYLDHINWLKEISKYDSDVILSSADQTLILQTCSSTNKDEFLLIAKGLSKNFGYKGDKKLIEDLIDFHYEWSQKPELADDVQCLTIREIAATIDAAPIGIISHN